MGCWSSNIIGSDKAVKVLDAIGAFIGLNDNPDLYWLYHEEKLMAPIRARLEPQQMEVFAHLNSPEFQAALGDSTPPVFPTLVLAAVLLATGSRVEDPIRDSTIFLSLQDAHEVEANGWRFPSLRRAIMLAFAEKVRNHQCGTLTDISFDEYAWLSLLESPSI